MLIIRSTNKTASAKCVKLEIMVIYKGVVQSLQHADCVLSKLSGIHTPGGLMVHNLDITESSTPQSHSPRHYKSLLDTANS